MSVLAPLAALFLLLVPVLVLFYLLKVRRQDYEVPSTFLWRHLTRDVTAHEPWQKLRWNPLLLLQALVLLLLIAALVRPYLARAGTTAGFEVIVLDGSASMLATDVAPSRFDAARTAARSLIARLPTGGQAAIIETGASPRALVGATSDRNALDAALAAARPTVSETDMRSALELALALAHSRRDPNIDVISDGAFPDVSEFASSGVPIHFVTIGGQGANEAITALAARPQPLAPQRMSVFVRVDNDGAKAAANQVELYADDHLVESKPVTAAPGASQDFVFDTVPAGAQIVEARLRDGDALAADNQAYLVLQRQPPPKVLLVTTGNRFLLTALRLLKVQLFQVTPNQLGAVDANSYDIVVLDGTVPPILPKGNLLLVNPPNSPLLPSQGTVGPVTVSDVQRDDPLLANVDLSTLQVLRAEKVTAPTWSHVLASGQGSPLLLTGQSDGHTIVALPFQLQDANLVLLPTFPILMSNIIADLTPKAAGGLTEAAKGSLLLIQPLPQADRIDVQRPDHTSVSLPIPKGGQSITYDSTDEAGLYVVTQRAGGRVLSQQPFAVNLLSPQESNIRPITQAPLGVSSAAAAGSAKPGIAPYELWPYLAVLAALLLLGEWWWYHRRA